MELIDYMRKIILLVLMSFATSLSFAQSKGEYVEKCMAQAFESYRLEFGQDAMIAYAVIEEIQSNCEELYTKNFSEANNNVAEEVSECWHPESDCYEKEEPVTNVVSYTNRLGVQMVDIPAGTFMMGSCYLSDSVVRRHKAENENRAYLGQPELPLVLKCGEPDPYASPHEAPRHEVSISSFQMAQHPVTLRQFKIFIAESGRTDLLTSLFKSYNEFGDDAPVIRVSWEDAQDFIRWLNKTDGGGWRLPSEAEWEYACRAGQDFVFCGSNDLDDTAWYRPKDSIYGESIKQVGLKQPSIWGLYDMNGNVYELTQDCYNDSYRNAPKDGKAWRAGNCTTRVMRGGSVESIPLYMRAASRSNIRPGTRSGDVGFRLARDIK